MNCPQCGFPATAHSRVVTPRHGERIVVIGYLYWTCRSGCRGTDRAHPTEFIDAETARINADILRAAWRLTYGEDYPGGPPGTVVRPRQADDPRGFELDGVVGLSL